MKKEITLCDSCGDELDVLVAASTAGPSLVGEGKNGRAFSFDLDFHPMTHGNPPRAPANRAGPPTDLCITCALSIVESGLRTRAEKNMKDAAMKESAA